jgi:hypothetical protein
MSYLITNYQLDAPAKVIWSTYHGLAISMGRRSIQTINSNTDQVELIQASESHDYVDIDVLPTGELLLILQPRDGGHYVARILDRNLTRITNEFLTDVKLSFGKLISASQFVVAGEDPSWSPPLVEVSSESTELSSSSSVSASSSSMFKRRIIRFISDQGADGYLTTDAFETLGGLVGLLYEPDWKFTLGVSSGGDIIQCPLELAFDLDRYSNEITIGEGSPVNLVKNIGAVTIAASGPQWTTEGENEQSKVRIFVGSQPWQSDRWDSGEVSTDKTTILYGGGDNLVPGMAYWVHIATYHEDSGWATPSIRRFVTPKE